MTVHWFRDLPTATALLAVLLGVLVSLTGLSLLLGVVFAGIAIGTALGSGTLGAIAAITGVTLVLTPVAVLAVAVTRLCGSADPRRTGWEPDELSQLKAQYTAGKIDEETFERRIDEVLGITDHHTRPAVAASSEQTKETSTESDR